MTLRHVLMTADAVGGVFTYALELAAALRQVGVRTTLAVMGPSPSEEQRQRALRVADLVEAPYALEWMPSPWADVAAAGEWLLDLERQLDVELVHLNGFAHAGLPFRTPVVMVAHSCVMTWWQACRREAAPPEWDRYRAAVAAGLESANAIVAPTRAMLDAFLAEHDPAMRHVARSRVVHNSVDPRNFRAGPHKLGVVFSAGRVWDEAKNLRLLDTVAGALPWTVAIAGSTTALSGARVELEQAASLGELAPEQLRDMLTHASVYALPARYEPFGLSALEAALSGCALVLGDIPSLRELWHDAALFADPDDALAWETALLRLARDSVLRSEVATRCRQRALALASPSRFAQEYLDVYALAAHSSERAKRPTLSDVWSVSEAPTERAELRPARELGSVRCA